MESKARSPTKETARKKENNGSVVNVVLFALQCSQRIGQWLTLLSAVHILTTLIAVMINPLLKEALVAVLETCIPYYRLGVSAYFGKAAVENVLKIVKDTRSIDTYTTNSESSDDENG